MYAQLLSGVTDPIIGLSLHRLPYIVYAISEGFDETAHMRSLVKALAGRRCDKYQTYRLMFWLSLFNTGDLLSWRNRSFKYL